MKKQFYIVLCMLLGVALLLVIQRAAAVIYFILANNNSAYDILTVAQLRWVDIGTAILAGLIGLMYGNYLGRQWYPVVYERDTVNSTEASALDQAQKKTVTVKNPVRKVGSTTVEKKMQDWDFDDLMKYDAPAVDSMDMNGPAVMSAVSLSDRTPTQMKRSVAKKTTPGSKTKSKTRTTAKPTVASKTLAIKTSTPKTVVARKTTTAKVKKTVTRKAVAARAEAS